MKGIIFWDIMSCNPLSQPTFRRNITPPSSVSKNKPRKKPAWRQVESKALRMSTSDMKLKRGNIWNLLLFASIRQGSCPPEPPTEKFHNGLKELSNCCCTLVVYVTQIVRPSAHGVARWPQPFRTTFLWRTNELYMNYSVVHCMNDSTLQRLKGLGLFQSDLIFSGGPTSEYLVFPSLSRLIPEIFPPNSTPNLS
jgi:hypothetical protein